MYDPPSPSDQVLQNTTQYQRSHSSERFQWLAYIPCMCVKEFCTRRSHLGVCYEVKVYLGQRDVTTVGGSGDVRLSKRPLPNPTCKGHGCVRKPKRVGPRALVNSSGGIA
jgi:hypothetical protein